MDPVLVFLCLLAAIICFVADAFHLAEPRRVALFPLGAAFAILPTLVGRLMGVDATISQFFGGTSLLILVGVILDTTKQIESHLLMKRYEGFMTKGKLRGR